MDRHRAGAPPLTDQATNTAPPAKPERLQKLIARAGFGSRRAAEELIAARRVRVDGRIAILGERADPATNVIEVDGRRIGVSPPQRTLMLHKPAGIVVTARDERGRRTIYSLIPDAPPALRYVGRLDRDTQGLLLLTTDGELVHRLTHPRYLVQKVYEAEVTGKPEEAALQRLRTGIQLEDGATAPALVEKLRDAPGGAVLRLTIHEGRKRQVRRMLDAVGHPVRRLTRVTFGGLDLGDLPPGASRPLTSEELQSLRELVGLVDAR